ncbi:hypothetical protein PILCRDRAFT_303944 [Piloderma croceum F 1598]|uniref:Uncharacterized protein n=1 Tax=Piloderma croceum (strain F 1598) TaxID=765440 RepID=A0A0C3FSM4_PILCF|nr:hypothetical protein PILCRDRAFT_303944 [Piloderma croceum F 1598]
MYFSGKQDWAVSAFPAPGQLCANRFRCQARRFPEQGTKRQQGENLRQGKQMDEQDSKNKEDKAKERRTRKEQNAEPQEQIKLNCDR